MSNPLDFSTTERNAAVQAFLADFARKAAEFGQACEQYQQGSISIADITRHLSEATADAEFFFSEHSPSMDMEQLQSYGQTQKQIDDLTVRVFEAEIANNRQTVLNAIQHGDYFIVNMTYNAIKSSIYMICAKHKIKTQQQQMLAEAQQELETAQTFIKVLKVLESVLHVEPPADWGWPKIQRALTIYLNYFGKVGLMPFKEASDNRVFGLFAGHAALLGQRQPPDWQAHLAACQALLRQLAWQAQHQTQLASWEPLLAQTAPAAAPVEADALAAVPELSEAPDNLRLPFEQLQTLLRVVDVDNLDFAQLEASLSALMDSLTAAGGVSAQPAVAHRVLGLFEGYVDFLCNADFAGDPLATTQHIEACCPVLESLAQTVYERQMIEAWGLLRSSLSVIYPSPRLEPAADAEHDSIQTMMKLFHTLEGLLGIPGKLQLEFDRLETALAAYSETLAPTAHLPIRASLDEQVFSLFEKHVDYLHHVHYAEPDPEADRAHIAACCRLLEPLAQDILLQELVKAWLMLSADPAA